MSMKANILCFFAVAVGVACVPFVPLLLPPLSAQAPTEKSLRSGLVRREEAVPTRGEWGEWYRYFRGETHGTKDMVVLAVTLKPGQEPHPPHRHAEEEFLILTEGTGIWHLDGKELPARKGDTVYATPWMLHGLKNTGAMPLTYYMVKWNNKGMKAPEMPTQKPKGNARRQGVKPPGIVGVWEAEDRHAAMGSLYQPFHRARQREATITFQQDGNRLTGYSLTPNYKDISSQESWKEGRTVFHLVKFSEGQLVFEFNAEEIRHGRGGEVKSKGKVRVEARLESDRLVGKWRMFAGDGLELFLGEWEAVRVKEQGK
jgi:mannose-6-phosphate isomerase-like protein (cupin superfamily)